MIINVKIKPNSDENKLEKIDEKNYMAKIKEKPKDNKANIQLIKLLKKYFNRDVIIKSGFTLRKKIIELR